MLVQGVRIPRHLGLLSLAVVAVLAVLIPTYVATGGTQTASGWRHPTKPELIRMRRAITAWACQENPQCSVAVPASRVHVGKAPFGGYGVIYATAAVEINPNTKEPQGTVTLLYRHGPARANSRHGRIVGLPSWWVPGGSPYIDAPPGQPGRFSTATCRYVKTKLQAVPDGC